MDHEDAHTTTDGARRSQAVSVRQWDAVLVMLACAVVVVSMVAVPALSPGGPTGADVVRAPVAVAALALFSLVVHLSTRVRR